MSKARSHVGKILKRIFVGTSENLQSLFETNVGIKRTQNLSIKKKSALSLLKGKRNTAVVTNDTDNYVTIATVDTTQVIGESRQQLYD